MDKADFITKIILGTITKEDFKQASTTYTGIKKILSSNKEVLKSFNIDVEIASLSITIFYLSKTQTHGMYYTRSIDIEGSPFGNGYAITGTI